MDAVYKFRLKVADYQEIEMNYGAEVLHIEAGEAHNGEAFIDIWARVESENSKGLRGFKVVGTGYDLKPTNQLKNLGGKKLEYVGSSSYISPLLDAKFVWHVFEVVKRQTFVMD